MNIIFKAKNSEIFTLRELEEKDNKHIEAVIRSCLIEYGANHEGTAWADPMLSRFSEIYNTEGNCYRVAQNSAGKIVGGVGIGELHGAEGVCELQKMYCLPDTRGIGLAKALMDISIDYAKKYYHKIYLETLPNMTAAQKFYEKCGFYRIEKPLVNTGHFACDVCYIKDLE